MSNLENCATRTLLWGGNPPTPPAYLTYPCISSFTVIKIHLLVLCGPDNGIGTMWYYVVRITE